MIDQLVAKATFDEVLTIAILQLPNTHVEAVAESEREQDNNPDAKQFNQENWHGMVECLHNIMQKMVKSINLTEPRAFVYALQNHSLTKGFSDISLLCENIHNNAVDEIYKLEQKGFPMKKVMCPCNDCVVSDNPSYWYELDVDKLLGQTRH